MVTCRFVLSLILANLTSAVVIIPGHIYQLVVLHQNRPAPALLGLEDNAPDVLLGDSASWPCCDAADWCWDQQGLNGLTVLVFLASVLSILLISLDRYYVRAARALLPHRIGLLPLLLMSHYVP